MKNRTNDAGDFLEVMVQIWWRGIFESLNDAKHHMKRKSVVRKVLNRWMCLIIEINRVSLEECDCWRVRSTPLWMSQRLVLLCDYGSSYELTFGSGTRLMVLPGTFILIFCLICKIVMGTHQDLGSGSCQRGSSLRSQLNQWNSYHRGCPSLWLQAAAGTALPSAACLTS